MVAPTNTYNSPVELTLGNVPADIDTPEGLYRELLDIHNAIEGLITFSGDENVDLAQEVTVSVAVGGKVRATLTVHISSNSAHGVTGENVGTEDFATEAIGGVALLATLLTNASTSSESVSTADASAAPGAYSQTQIQEIVDLVNDCKATINTFIATDYNGFITNKFNSLLAKIKTALQMNTV